MKLTDLHHAAHEDRADKQYISAQQPFTQAVVSQLTSWGARDALLASAMFHEPVSSGALSVDHVRALCGDHAAFLCKTLCDIAQIMPLPDWRGAPHVLQRIQLYAAAYRHPEAAILMVARLWTALFGEADASQPDAGLSQGGWRMQRKQIVETLDAALEMLGMRAVRLQLGKLLTSRAKKGDKSGMNEELARHICSQLSQSLPLECSVRAEPAMSLAAARTTVNSSPQPLAFCVLVGDEEACYRALYHLHRVYQPLDGAVSDTLRACRNNGYRSLHTAVTASVAGRTVRLDVDICTPEMEQVNLWGVAAFYRRAGDGFHLTADAMGASVYHNAWWQNAPAKDAAIRSAAPGSLDGETVYVFSPAGELFSFPSGCTVVDYAYHLHSHLAEQCQRFRINGETVEPATPLRHLDLVELELGGRAPGPTLAWLNAARTKRARTNIRRFLRVQGEGEDAGRRIVNARLAVLEEYYGFHIPEDQVEEAIRRAARHLRLTSTQELLAELAASRLTADRFLYPLFAGEIVRRLQPPPGLRLRPHQLILAQCCRPRPGDDIVGRPHRRKGMITKLTVHRRDCPHCKADIAEAEVVPCLWRLQGGDRTLAQVEITARDEDGLLGDVLAEIYSRLPYVSLLRSEAQARRGVALLRFNLDAENQAIVDDIVESLRRLPKRELSSVRVHPLSPSEQDGLLGSSLRPANPYNRLPVIDPAMFFGRGDELQRMERWVRNGVACIWLRGQKRVGKTSLLLQLQRLLVESNQFACAFVDFQLLSNLTRANIFFEIASAIFDELQRDPRVLALGAPTRAQFDSDAPLRLVRYLRDLHSRLGNRRLVCLFDEFSRVTDYYLDGRISGDFFHQWRGVLQASGRICSFVTVVQQKTFERMAEYMAGQRNDPCWQVLEVGETVHLRPLSPADARRLIEWPMRNLLTYEPGVVEKMMYLTGVSPFLIQSFCSKLITRLGGRNEQSGRTVAVEDVEAVAEEFMQPSESIFAHLLDLIHGLGNPVSTQLALLAESNGRGMVSWAEIKTSLPHLDSITLATTLDQLVQAEILDRPETGMWRFNNTLFQRWLVRNS